MYADIVDPTQWYAGKYLTTSLGQVWREDPDL